MAIDRALPPVIKRNIMLRCSDRCPCSFHLTTAEKVGTLCLFCIGIVENTHPLDPSEPPAANKAYLTADIALC
jgi:hypothetical protein